METLEPTPAIPPRTWCLFRSDSRPFAIGLESVAEIVEADRLVRLSHCPSQVVGLCAVRRDVVPVLCLNPRPGGDEPPTSPKQVVLILRTDQGAWGIRIDREGTAVADGDLDAASGVTSGGAAIVGSLSRGETVHTVIDPAQTWKNVREYVEECYHK